MSSCDSKTNVDQTPNGCAKSQRRKALVPTLRDRLRWINETEANDGTDESANRRQAVSPTTRDKIRWNYENDSSDGESDLDSDDEHLANEFYNKYVKAYTSKNPTQIQL
tara:strand:- start:6892 stop:7218 length:327 start_codon:yes stop_codon:yes gene_type:complete